MQNYFAYICVSTAKQSVLGVSLQEQHSAIETYTKRYNRNIIEWFGNKLLPSQKLIWAPLRRLVYSLDMLQCSNPPQD